MTELAGLALFVVGFVGGFAFGCAFVLMFVKGADAKIKRLQELNK